MALAWVIEIYHVKLGRYLIAVSVLNQVVIGDNGQVIKFKVVYIKCIGLLDCLLYVIIDHRIRLTATRRAYRWVTCSGLSSRAYRS